MSGLPGTLKIPLVIRLVTKQLDTLLRRDRLLAMRAPHRARKESDAATEGAIRLSGRRPSRAAGVFNPSR